MSKLLCLHIYFYASFIGNHRAGVHKGDRCRCVCDQRYRCFPRIISEEIQMRGLRIEPIPTYYCSSYCRDCCCTKQGNLLGGNVNLLGVAWSVVYVRLTDIGSSFSNNFSLFKPLFKNNVGHTWFPFRK